MELVVTFPTIPHRIWRAEKAAVDFTIFRLFALYTQVLGSIPVIQEAHFIEIASIEEIHILKCKFSSCYCETSHE